MSESWQALKAKGNSEYTSGNTDAAIEAYTAALKDTEIPANDKATILCNRAQCWLKLGDNKKAAEDCTSCLTIAPDNMKALFRRAAAFEALDQKKDALKDYREVLRINPSVSDAIAAVRRLEVALGEAPSQPAKGSRKGQQQGGGLTEEDAKQLEETKTRVKEVALQKIKAKDAQQTAAKEKRQLELTLSQVQALPATVSNCPKIKATHSQYIELQIAVLSSTAFLPPFSFFLQSATYKPVGRAFIATPKTEMVTSLNEKMAKCEQKLKVCATALEHIEKQEKEADAHFLEVVNSVRSRMQA
jgi:tetratricopeptide (TPR) repeat protein